MSKYSCRCPAPGCNFVLVVLAESQKEALVLMYKEGSRHMVNTHPDFPDFIDHKKKLDYALKNIREC